MQHKFTIFFIVLCSLFFTTACFAHKVRIFAWGEGNIIHTESKFSGGRPAQNATVTIIDKSSGAELLRGTTDQHGLFEFPVPEEAIQEIDIVVNSGDGHKNNWLYQLTEKDDNQENLAHTDVGQVGVDSKGSAATTLTEEQLSRIINESLEKKLAPIRQQLAEAAEQKPDLKDILGGIGYILGLAGIAAYMKSKKQ